MLRQIVRIDEEKCDGCGACIVNCPEGALQLIDGKARLVKESYCDGLGACLGPCPQGAITIEEREAEGFDEEAVRKHMAATSAAATSPHAPVGHACPGAAVRRMRPAAPVCEGSRVCRMPTAGEESSAGGSTPSQLVHWPVQLALVPPNAPFLKDADLLLAADCVPFALADFHTRFLTGRSVVVGCPKLDDAAAYADKLTAVFEQCRPRSLTIIHMEVPCCTGLCRIAQAARRASGRDIPVKEITVSIDGYVIAENDW